MSLLEGCEGPGPGVRVVLRLGAMAEVWKIMGVDRVNVSKEEQRAGGGCREEEGRR